MLGAEPLSAYIYKCKGYWCVVVARDKDDAITHFKKHLRVENIPKREIIEINYGEVHMMKGAQ